MVQIYCSLILAMENRPINKKCGFNASGHSFLTNLLATGQNFNLRPTEPLRKWREVSKLRFCAFFGGKRTITN